jgi:hypothetical protein
MERSDLIQLLHRDGRPYAILPGKPLHLAAYRKMMRDKRLVGVMEKRRLSAIRKLEMEYVVSYENEMKDLSTILKGVKDSNINRDKDTIQGLEARFRDLGFLLKTKTEKVKELERGIVAASMANKELDVEEEAEDDLVATAFS